MVLSASSLFREQPCLSFSSFFMGNCVSFERERERSLERTSLSDSKKRLLAEMRDDVLPQNACIFEEAAITV